MRALEQLYAKSTSKVRVGAKFSEKFPCSVGVRQGCVLSPSLFNVFLEEIVSTTVGRVDRWRLCSRIAGE